VAAPLSVFVSPSAEARDGTVSGDPHPPQNRVPSSFPVPHFAQNMPVLSIRSVRLGCYPNQPPIASASKDADESFFWLVPLRDGELLL
jgi:hypothetical protein